MGAAEERIQLAKIRTCIKEAEGKQVMPPSSAGKSEEQRKNEVRFRWKNPDFRFKKPDLLSGILIFY